MKGASPFPGSQVWSDPPLIKLGSELLFATVDVIPRWPQSNETIVLFQVSMSPGLIMCWGFRLKVK